MNIETFFNYWGIEENPFKAEEARDDPVYLRIMDSEMAHPDFEKILGSPQHPSTSVVFGEKGSGKTAIRLLLEQRIKDNNEKNSESRVWLVTLDDLNLFVDNFLNVTRAKDTSAESLSQIRLSDHMDNLLSESVTRLVDFLLKEDCEDQLTRRQRKRLRRMNRQKRLDFAVLAFLYDYSRLRGTEPRWHKLSRLLRVKKIFNLKANLGAGLVSLVAFCVLALLVFLFDARHPGIVSGMTLAGILFLWFGYSYSRVSFQMRRLAKKIATGIRVIPHNILKLKHKMSDFSSKELLVQPLPIPGNQDSRYELMLRFMRILQEIGYNSLMVLYDRIDEPSVINGDPEKMKAVIWPVFNNKFLQQRGIGIKLLLPQELGYLLKRENAEFFQQARLDKQNLVERLEWTGSTLYDICSKRLQGCQGEDGKVKKLADIFAEDVNISELIEALDQMSQPRDAFKFLYRVIQEHCLNTPDENPQWKIPKLMLDQVRKQQSRRVSDLSRGLSPA